MLKTSSIVTIAFFLAFFLSPQASNAYELEWNQTQIKIQLLPGEDEAKAEFVVTNKGKETVSIDRIKTSCGCTGSVLNKKIIKPGESTTITGTFKKGNRKGLSHNRLQVFLENQVEPVQTLHMLVQIPQFIDIQPSIVYWSRSSAKTERTVQIKLDTRYVNKINTIEYDPELLLITEEDHSDANADRALAILPKSFDQQLRHTVLIKATGENDIVAEANLMVFVQP